MFLQTIKQLTALGENRCEKLKQKSSEGSNSLIPRAKRLFNVERK